MHIALIKCKLFFENIVVCVSRYSFLVIEWVQRDECDKKFFFFHKTHMEMSAFILFCFGSFIFFIIFSLKCICLNLIDSIRVECKINWFQINIQWQSFTDWLTYGMYVHISHTIYARFKPKINCTSYHFRILLTFTLWRSVFFFFPFLLCSHSLLIMCSLFYVFERKKKRQERWKEKQIYFAICFCLWKN